MDINNCLFTEEPDDKTEGDKNKEIVDIPTLLPLEGNKEEVEERKGMKISIPNKLPG